MNTIIVAGLINLETTVRIKGFPIEYFPIDYPFHGIKTEISGVAFNITSALNKLGETVEAVSLLGEDKEAAYIEKVFQDLGLSSKYLKKELSATSQSVVLYDAEGRREIYCDLKDIQDRVYKDEALNELFEHGKVAVICNINFARSLLPLARNKNIMIATDLHVLDNINDSYNQEFMEYADIIFLSDEGLTGAPEKFLMKLKSSYNSKIIVLGQGSRGAMIYVREEDALYHMDAVYTRRVVNTVGAGDALFSAFIHYYAKDGNPLEALKRAQLFASYKIGETGAANGFLSETEVNNLYENIDFKMDKIW